MQSADACGVQQRQQMDLAMVVVDPLEGLHYDNSNNNSTGEQQHEDPPHLDLAKAGEVRRACCVAVMKFNMDGGCWSLLECVLRDPRLLLPGC